MATAQTPAEQHGSQASPSGAPVELPEGTADARPPLRVLVISARFPFPPSWGFARRVFHLVEGLAQCNRVSVLCYVMPEDDPSALSSFSDLVDELVTVPKPVERTSAKRARQALSLLSKTPFLVQSVRDPQMQRALDDLLSRTQFDVVQIESSQMGWLRFPNDVPVIVDEHNIESEVMTRSSRTEASLPRRLFNAWEGQRYRRFEKAVWRRSSACATTSVRDAQEITSTLPGTDVSVVPNGVDCQEFAPTAHLPRPNSMVFVGLLKYRPNVEGLQWFLTEVYPLVRAANPDATLTIVGDGPEDLLESLRRPGVTVTGWVEDVRPYMLESAVVVVPLRIGGGTRLKVVEAMAMAKAIVSTSLGAEGIDVEPGRHLVLADGAREFADSVVGLIADLDAGARLGSEARALAESHYSWSRAAATLEELHLRLVDRDRSRGSARDVSGASG